MEKYDLLLVSASFVEVHRRTLPPLALARLCGYLRSKNVSVKAYDMNILYDFRKIKGLTDPFLYVEIYNEFFVNKEKLKSSIKREIEILYELIDKKTKMLLEHKPKILGFSLGMYMGIISLLIAKRIKEIDPNIKIVFGGPECSLDINAFPFINLDFVDFVITGDGELSIEEVVKQVKKEEYTMIPGALCKLNGKIVYEKNNKLLVDMNSLPYPDFSDFNMKKYLPGYIGVEFVRGCAANCTFCHEPGFWSKFRQTSPKIAVDTMKYLKEKYNFHNFFLMQPIISMNMKWLSEFCDELIDRKVGIYWEGNLRINPIISANLMKKAYLAGCRTLFFGVESGSQKVLNDMKKGITIDSAMKVLKHSKEAGIWTNVYWMICFTTETKEDLIKTIDFMVSLYPWVDAQSVNIFNLHMGTPEYDNLLRKGIISRDYMPNEKTKKLQAFNDIEELVNMRSKTYFKYKHIIDKLVEISLELGLVTYNTDRQGKLILENEKETNYNFLLSMLLIKYGITNPEVEKKLNLAQLKSSQMKPIFKQITDKYPLEDLKINQKEIVDEIIKFI